MGDISQPTTSPMSTVSPAAAPAALRGPLRSPPSRTLSQVLDAPLCVVLLAQRCRNITYRKPVTDAVAAIRASNEDFAAVSLVLPFSHPFQSHETCHLFFLHALLKSPFRVHAPSLWPTWARPGPHKLWRHATDSVTDTPQGRECTSNEIGQSF